jgi:hypothetical protein
MHQFLEWSGSHAGWLMTEAVVLVVALIPLAGMGAYLHHRTQASDGRAHLTCRAA